MRDGNPQRAEDRELDRLGVARVPEGWVLSSVGEACVIRNDLREPLSVEVRAQMKGKYPYYGPTGILSHIHEFRIDGEFALIGEDGDHFMDPSAKSQTIKVCGRFNVNNHAHIVGSSHACAVDWFFHFFRHRDISHSLTRQGAGRFKLTKRALEKLPILLPPLAEQRKIAAILRTWDLGLEKLSALRKAKERRFIGLRQHLFGGRGGYTGHWQFKPLSTITTRVRRKNDGGDHPVMTISAKSGFLMQSDKFARDMAGTSAERYTLLHQGEFAYNKGNSLTAPYGCIYELDRPTAVVPFVYYSFALNAGFDRMFYKHLFSGGVLNHQLSRVINSGVRNDGLLNLDVEDFFGCKVPVPPIDEQREIGRILTTAKAELDLLDREINAIKRQKRGLMQKLLTGEWPVNIEGVAA